MSAAIDRAQMRAMKCLNGWADAMKPTLNAVEMHELKRRMTEAFREYEEKLERADDVIHRSAPVVFLSKSFLMAAAKVCGEKFAAATYFGGDARIVRAWADLQDALTAFSKGESASTEKAQPPRACL